MERNDVGAVGVGIGRGWGNRVMVVGRGLGNGVKWVGKDKDDGFTFFPSFVFLIYFYLN